MTGWIESLNAVNKVFPFGDLPFCERRARQILQLNTTKMVRKSPFLNPHWKDFINISEQTVSETKKISDDLLSTVEAYALDDNPVTELQVEIDRKKLEVAQSVKDWQELLARIKGDNAHAYYFTGANPQTLASQIKSIDKSSTMKFCAIFAVIANSEADIRFFKEAFEL